ncbi:MAG TPA: heme ABC transporter ATP-binding protein, partial [Rhodothermales bacterium]|nr:heme ABC transporter ATP-binding protein [Rhodothermales bacterium]
MLRLDHVSVRIGSAALLTDVTLEVTPGTLTALVGPNGAGKSTLLRVASGERVPEAGTVTLDGAPIQTIPPDVLARRRAVLPQESLLSFPFTAFEVALLGRTPYHVGREADARAAVSALERAGVLDLSERRYPTLSGGEKQRVHLARVLAQLDGPEAAMLLLDEPTNNLDLTHQHRVLDVARGLARAGLGVVAVLHDLNLAAQYADRVALLVKGRLVAEGTPTDVLRPELVQRAFDVPVMVVPHPCLDCPLVLPVPHGTVLPDLPILTDDLVL